MLSYTLGFPMQRDVLMLSYKQGFPFREISSCCHTRWALPMQRDSLMLSYKLGFPIQRDSLMLSYTLGCNPDFPCIAAGGHDIKNEESAQGRCRYMASPCADSP